MKRKPAMTGHPRYCSKHQVIHMAETRYKSCVFPNVSLNPMAMCVDKPERKPREVRFKVGDILRSQWNYFVLVCKDKDGKLYGSLICDINDSCRNIPYAIDRNHILIYRPVRIVEERKKR